MGISFVKGVQKSRSIDRSVGDLNHNSTIPCLNAFSTKKVYIRKYRL